MKVLELYKPGSSVLSLEVFPPRRDYPLETIYQTVEELQKLNPGFISVTYGAGGSTRDRTVEIAAHIKKHYSMEVVAHLTCVAHCRSEVDAILESLWQENIRNIMALRGDLPEDDPTFDINACEYRYASELIRDARKKADFGILAAAYPEGHPECERLDQDLGHLKEKVDSGVDVLITQFFFDNRKYYDFIDKAERIGITCPIVPGIMPVLNANQIKRMLYLSGASLPGTLVKLLDLYGEVPADMEKAGIDFASRQIENLLSNDVPGIHLYTMNKPRQITQIVKNVGMA
ncbi:MAG: methylenetetrahydrofolate reductase [NAD(P)H] [Syntrophomonadaceae bacterium]|jgi:methylenetetrahydrofolate reductase (NADPH)